jgi:hypothetical protein
MPELQLQYKCRPLNKDIEQEMRVLNDRSLLVDFSLIIDVNRKKTTLDAFILPLDKNDC